MSGAKRGIWSITLFQPLFLLEMLVQHRLVMSYPPDRLEVPEGGWLGSRAILSQVKPPCNYEFKH